MRRLTLPLLLVLAACARHDGAWPTLARRPIEGPPLVSAEPRRCAVATGAASCQPPASAAPGGSAATAAPAAATTPMGAVPAAAAAATLPPTPPVVIDDVPTKLAVIDRDLADAASRLATQRSAATAAATAAHGAPPSSDASARAEIERTALDRVGNQIADLRGRLDQIAGTLAAASSGGADVAAPLAATGRLIARATALTADYDTAAASLH